VGHNGPRTRADEAEAFRRVKAWRAEIQPPLSRGTTPSCAPEDELDEVEPDVEREWKDVLIERLMKMSPDAFERLAQRLLREAGFRNVEVLGKSGDGGIDGVGVYRLSLVSFPAYFQCKRWANQVTSGAVRDIRGAMSRRGEKGLLITTATFSPAAREEATRDGAPPVELISGEDLCDLLKEHELGVVTTARTIEDIRVIEDFSTSCRPLRTVTPRRGRRRSARTRRRSVAARFRATSSPGR
jgi:restriction endonuclease Mrr